MPSAGDVTGFWQALDGWRHALDAPRLRHALDLFFDDDIFRHQFEECPASIRGHHAELGGLLRHTWEVASIARTVSRVAGADCDLVLAGALLHDIGKIEAYSWAGLLEVTAQGHLYGHVVLGTLMLDRRMRVASPCQWTEDELAILHHLILSHHGRYEFGAPVQPMTLEAEILHYADNASAKSASMADALANPEYFAGEDLISTAGIWQIDRRRGYRGTATWGRRGASQEYQNAGSQDRKNRTAT